MPYVYSVSCYAYNTQQVDAAYVDKAGIDLLIDTKFKGKIGGDYNWASRIWIAAQQSGQDPNEGARTPQQWFNTAAFSVPAAFTYGDAGRNIVIGPGIFNTDASIIRNFMLGGSKSIQFRLEAFNLFNKPIWGDPQMALSSPLYGQINTTRSPMRELQIGVKFAF